MASNTKLSFSQQIKFDFLFPYLKKEHKILDLGCGDMWLTNKLSKLGYNVKGFSLEKPADIIGNVKTYPFKSNTYDIVIALEFIEHVDCYKEIKAMLKPGGLLIVTTPVPHWDWFCLVMEKLGIFQSRGSTPHKYLIYLKNIPFFKPINTKTLLINQLGVFKN